MNKKLLAVFSLLASLTLFAACGGGETSESTGGTSTGGDVTSESTGGESTGGDEECEHTGGTATCTEKAVCDECGEEYGELAAHDYSVLQSDDDSHWYKCANCDATDGDAAHVAGTEVKYDATNHWNECECGYKMNVTTHTILGGRDENYHWGECECGYEATQVAHEYTVAKSDATYHWNECVCGAIDESSKAEHSYTEAKHDDTNHWNECSCGAKSDEEAHVAGTEVKYDATNHWNECECGYAMNVEGHEATAWQYDNEKHWKGCNDCDWTGEEAQHNLVYSLVDNVYTLGCECGLTVDLTDTIEYFDRMNKNLLQSNGKIKNNTANYWDGDASIVTVAKQDSGVKLSFNFSQLTAEQLAAADAAWAGWSGLKQMWVGYAIPVDNLDLTEFELVLDAKMENMNTKITAYAATDYEGEEDAVYEVGAESYFDVADAQDLGDGWYRYTITVDCSTAAGKAADYIILSLDNTSSGIDMAAESIAYIDNVTLNKIVYYTVSADDVEESVRAGTEYTPETPTKEGYEFTGWVDADGNAVETPITVNGDITLESTWKKLPVAVQLYKPVSIDLASAIAEERYYDVMSFSGVAGTYNLLLEGGIKAYPLVDGKFDIENPGEELTQLELADETTVTFAVTYTITDDGDIATTGTAMATLDDAEVRYSIWRNDKYALSASTEEPAPIGFSKVSEFNWLNNTTMVPEKVNNVETGNMIPYMSNQKDFATFIVDTTVDLSKYTDIYFAWKLQGGDGFYLRGQAKYMGNEWLYIHLQQADDGASWTLTANAADGYSAIQTGLTGNNLQTLLTYGTASGCYPTQVVGETTEAIIYMTEVVGIAIPQPPYDPGISTDAEQISSSALIGTPANWNWIQPSEAASAVTVPVGFETVNAYESFTADNDQWLAAGNTRPSTYGYWASSNLNQGAYDGTDLSNYSEVWFALKLANAKMSFVSLNKDDIVGTLDTPSKWMYFHLTQNSDGTWTVEVTYDSEVYVTATNQEGSTLKELLYDDGYSSTDGGAFLIYQNNGTPIYLWSTEVVGVEKPFDPAIPEDAEILWNHVWNNYYFTGGDIPEGAYAEDVTAPAGYSYVSEYSFVGGDFPKTGHINNSDVSAYSDLYFAMKVANGRDIYVQGGPNQSYTGGDWLYIHLHQEDDGTWTKTLRSSDGYKHTQTGLTGYQYKIINSTAQTYEILREYPTLCDLLGYTYAFTGAGGTGSYPRGDGSSTTTAYFTDVLAIKKEGTITPPTAPDHATGPFEVDIPDNAITARAYPWRDDRYALTAQANVTMAAPEGYSYVIEDVWNTHHTNITDQYTYALDETLDVTAYSDLYFAMKIVDGSFIYVKDNTSGVHYTGTDWLYVHYHQDSTGVWSYDVKSPDGYHANGNSTISATKVKALIEGVVYGVRESTDMTTTKTYFTELLGVLASQPTEEVVIESAVDGAVATTDVIGIPVGFTSAFKYENFSADKFAAMDLTNTEYESLSFGMLANTNNVMLTDTYKNIDYDTYGTSDYANFRATTSNAGAMYTVDLVNNGNGNWTVTVNTKVYFDPTGAVGTQNQPSFTATVTGNSLSEIMSAFMKITDSVTTVYVTEVRGVAKTTEA